MPAYLRAASSVLCCLLFYFKGLLQIIPQATVYADDCAIFFNERDFPEQKISESRSNTSSITRLCSDEWQVYFSPDQIHVIIVSWQQTDMRSQGPVIMSEVKLKSAPDLKKLGVTVDKKLTFASHIWEIVVRASRKTLLNTTYIKFTWPQRMLHYVKIKSPASNGILSIDLEQLFKHKPSPDQGHTKSCKTPNR